MYYNKVAILIQFQSSTVEQWNVAVNLSENMLIDESLNASEKINSRRECFSLSEVADHGDASDCWIIIYDRVYRITNFLNKVRHLLIR